MVIDRTVDVEGLGEISLDWEVVQEDVYTGHGSPIPGYKVNLRSSDGSALGIVSDRYKVVQNEDAFRFTDDLLGAGVTVTFLSLRLILDRASMLRPSSSIYRSASSKVSLASWMRPITFCPCGEERLPIRQRRQ